MKDEQIFSYAYGSKEGDMWRCPNLIVANEFPKVRRAHRCVEERDHKGKHVDATGQTWWWNKRSKKFMTEGPLADVVFVTDIEWSANKEAWGASLVAFLTGAEK